MPARQPFTVLCQTLARPIAAGRADLHLHTIHSDGSYSPAEVISLAKRSGLGAIAVTDHDTLAAVPECRRLGGSDLEVVAGVEISAEYEGAELHLLGYFVRLDDLALTQALEQLRVHRLQRFRDMARRLQDCGVKIAEEDLAAGTANGTLGRRNLADLLVRTGQAGSVREVFQRFLGDRGRATLPKVRLPVSRAIELVRGAGGVASWAHPSYASRENLAALRGLGLQAVEVLFPGASQQQSRKLRTWADELGLAVTGGSDCHGPGHYRRAVGACSITALELERLRALASEPQTQARAHR